MTRLWITAGAFFGLTGVAMAALLAHAFPNLDAGARQLVHTALEIQVWHALVLLFTGLWASRGGLAVDLAGTAFTVGVVLFCGAVDALALFGIHLPMLAPIGGSLLMLGWLLLGISALTHR